jgi:hypothetical protein
MQMGGGRAGCATVKGVGIELTNKDITVNKDSTAMTINLDAFDFMVISGYQGVFEVIKFFRQRLWLL